jgi:spore photoproduct lyase
VTLSSTCHRRTRKTSFVEIFRTTPPQTVCPNFFVLAHTNGCGFRPQCSYCYLKSSFWFLKGQAIFTNVDRMIRDVRRWIARNRLETYMLNAGNLSDSLSLERVRPIMPRLIDVFRQAAKGRRHTLLLVTKGGMKDCAHLLKIPPCGNVVISFSVNHPDAARRFESGAASTTGRLRAARALKQKGWRIRIRIDPMILGYDYTGVARAVRALRPERVTLGSLRAEYNLPRFVPNGLFKDLEPAPDKKSMARYPLAKRLALYRPAVRILRDVCSMGLCEETPGVWDALGLHKEAKSCNCCV